MSVESFVAHLEELAMDGRARGALAALRRGIGVAPGTAPSTWPHVAPYLPQDVSAREEAAYYAVASLFALYRRSGQAVAKPPEQPWDFGVTLRRLAERRPVARSGIERRFLALLDARFDDLPYYLRQLMVQVREAEVAMDWERLLRDLVYWSSRDLTVQRRWARRFYAREEVKPDAEPA